MTETNKPGKGWRGDSEGHARAGRLGGLAKGKSKVGEFKTNESSENDSENK